MLKKIDERLSRLEEVRKQSQRLLIKLSVSDNNKASKSDIVKMESESVSPEKDVAVKSKTLKELRVAGIMDRFTLDCFKPECTLTELTPDGWRSEMEQAKPELLFIESAWEGKDSLWHGKVNHCSSELCDLTDYCHSNNIPVIFWNKEDPVYTDTFMQTAQRADYVFTTDIECIQKYKTELGHERVYHMHFAAQPCIHNPIEKFERKDKVCFAGAYYHRYADRCKVFDSFADYFIDNRGIDIYDRNYPSPRPEHKFPERYDPYILGKLDPADIDVAYKGYLFGINMNSVIQSQSMFARRVFELMASNTIVIGNYSRGVKNYFGDLTICTDDGKTLKYTLEYYCSSRDSLAKLRLLALRKVLSEHLCEDRLDYIVQKVFGKSLKVKLPSVSVLARVENQEEVIHTLKNFRRQNYNNKKLILVGINIPAESDDVHVMSPEQFDSMKISEIFKSDFITYFAPSDWYGSNYLTDMALTTRYGAFDAIGKASFYASKNNDIIKIGAGEEYHYSNNLVIRRAMLRTGLYEQHYCNELTENLSITTEKAFSIDAINYCENLMGELCPVAEDMILADQGISLDKIDEAAAHIEPAISLTERKVVSAAEISQTLTGNVPVKFEMSENGAVIDSKLQDGVHQYIYMKEFIQIDALCEADKLTVLFKGRGELDLVCGCMFYDEQKMKLEAKYPKLGRKEMIQVPSGAKFLKLMFRPKGKGHAIIEEIILGGGSSESLHGGCFLSRSNMLILTNHYPAPDNLYRNMFVHKRVTSYREQQFVVDVMRMNKYANDGFREFEGINVVEGNSDILSFILSTGKIDTVCVHFLDLDMWTVLKDYLDNIRLIVWSHGADIQPWWRRTFNYKTNDELEQAKSESEKRMALWNEVFDVSETKNIHFVYVSKYFADEVMEDYKRNLPADKYSIIHNMIDTDLFDYKVKNPELRYKILTIKPFSSAKYANDLTTKAICELSKREVFNKLEFAIYGDGEDFDTDNKPLMKFNNVKLFRGFLTQKTISEIHKNYGIFIATTRWDSHGVSRDEAMSSGLVPITNAVSAIPEFTDESCAILAPSDDYIEIANGIEKLCDNPDLFLKMSKNAAERVRNQTSKEHTIIKELKLISSCETINYNNRGGAGN